jgi:hypothetical protein
MRTLACCALFALLTYLSACKADIPDGVYACDTSADCPAGYSCRAEDSAADGLCFADEGSASGDPDAGGRSGSGAPSSGSGGRSGSNAGGSGGSNAGGSGGNFMPEPVAPTRASFSSGGERRGADGFVLYDDGFEHGERLCTTDRALCVTGGFSP